jgi:hypothetical protein
MRRSLAILCALAFLSACRDANDERSAHELAHRGVVAVHGDIAAHESPRGTRLVRFAEVPGLVEAVAADDLERMLGAVDEADVSGLLVGRGEGRGVLGQMMKGVATPPLRTIFLDTNATYFEVEPMLELEEVHRLALARAARQILGGAPRPPIGYFPAPLREVRSVEVMVLLRDRGHARLWRSARAGSIASALVMAAEAARERWSERADALGGSLEKSLPRLDVEVALLIEDGTYLDRRPVFLASALEDDHGVGFEQGGKWRYLLPARVRELGDEAREKAFRALLEENSLPPSSLERSDVRLYRLRVHPLATSPASKAAFIER